MRWLPRAAARHPDRVAIESPEGSLTYAELLERAQDPGSLVPLDMPPGLDFVVALHATLLADKPAVPLDPRLGERERAAVPDAVGDDVALIVHTSGTTGAPTQVHITYANIEANARGSAEVLGLDPEERWLCPLPLSHVGGLMVLLRSVIYGTTAVLGPATRAADDDITIASLVPTQLHRLIESGAKPGKRLRHVLLGGAAATKTQLESDWPVAETYGLTQACSQVTVNGRPLPGLGIDLAPDGEILVTGPTVAGGGTLHTGDLGRWEDGRLRIVGRKSDTIVTGGENVAPAEVEAALLEHPAVADAAVFARPDPEWGEAVTASVVLRTATDPEELRAFVGERLARFKIPKAVEVAERLPRNASGKLLRRELR